ncbi:MAG: alkaline phosphatase family protein [Acidobacteriota bacterium]
MRKLLILGLDGATWDLIAPWAEAGELPFFRRLLEAGAHGPLRSVTPNLTPPGWTTAFTGVNPGKHGIFDFFTLDPGAEALRVVSSADRRAPALWEILSAAGRKVGVFNVPCTFPADAVRGFFVTGMGTPSLAGPWVFPREEAEALLRDFPGFRLGADPRPIAEGRLEAYLDQLYRLTDLQEGLFLDRTRRYACDTGVFVYDDLDRVMHFFWRFMDPSHPRHQEAPPRLKNAVLDYYRRVDEGMARLYDAWGPEADLCVLSDHGFGPLHTDVFLNRLLAGAGYLHPLPVAAELIRKPLWKRAVRVLLPQGLRTWFRKNVKASPLGNPLGYLDWEQTRAFYASVSGRSVYLNVRGRQPRGTVEAGPEYERLREEIRDFILGIRDPETGEPIAQAVHYREQVYRGPLVDRAPDLVIQEDGRFAYRVDWSERAFAPASQYGVDKSGSHRPEGILVLYGPSFQRGRLSGATLEDVTPTLLAALGLPVGEEMDGRVLREAFAETPSAASASYAALRGGTGTSALNAGEEAELAERLKGLGYM